jgi:outer membrane protein assembly factor BamB
MSLAIASLPAAGDTLGFRGPHRDGHFVGPLPRVRPTVAWTFATDGPVRSSPVLHDGALLFGSGDGHLYSVDAASGRERWRMATGGPVDGSAAIAGDLAVVASRDGNLYAVEAASGRQRWRLARGGGLPVAGGWGVVK